MKKVILIAVASIIGTCFIIIATMNIIDFVRLYSAWAEEHNINSMERLGNWLLMPLDERITVIAIEEGWHDVYDGYTAYIVLEVDNELLLQSDLFNDSEGNGNYEASFWGFDEMTIQQTTYYSEDIEYSLHIHVHRAQKDGSIRFGPPMKRYIMKYSEQKPKRTVIIESDPGEVCNFDVAAILEEQERRNQQK